MYPQRSVMTCGLATALEPPHFNHAPVRGAIGASFSRRSRAGSFNPRTRVGCDQCVCVSCLQLHCVSIHAPAWGATWAHTFFRYLTTVSIHAPAWGATCRRWPHRYHRHRFNPRTRVGCDSGDGKPTFQFAGFNPRTRVGCDERKRQFSGVHEMFQSTHPRGVRRHAH